VVRCRAAPQGTATQRIRCERTYAKSSVYLLLDLRQMTEPMDGRRQKPTAYADDAYAKHYQYQQPDKRTQSTTQNRKDKFKTLHHRGRQVNDAFYFCSLLSLLGIPDSLNILPPFLRFIFLNF